MSRLSPPVELGKSAERKGGGGDWLSACKGQSALLIQAYSCMCRHKRRRRVDELGQSGLGTQASSRGSSVFLGINVDIVAGGRI